MLDRQLHNIMIASSYVYLTFTFQKVFQVLCEIPVLNSGQR